MKKTFIPIFLFCLVFNFSSCTKTSEIPIEDINSPTPEETVSEENTIINMFINNATYDSGSYAFREYKTLNNTTFLRTFSYSPSYNMYHCSLLTTTRVNQATMYDYGSITFSWDNIKNGSFYGYHEFNYNTTIAIIEFNYSNIIFNNNYTLGSNFSYSVTKNTFQNLTSETDINKYALENFDCLNQAVGYAQSIIYSYEREITLW